MNYCQYQTTSDRKNKVPQSEYSKTIEPGLIKLINKHKHDNWKIQLTMKIIFTSILMIKELCMLRYVDCFG